MKSWQNFEPAVSVKSAYPFNISGDKRSLQTDSFTTISENYNTISSDQTSETSNYSKKSLFLNQIDKSNCSTGEEIIKSSTASISFSPIATKCFVGGTQRRKKNYRDSFETSFISATNILKEYIIEKKQEKENYLSPDEHLAKFIVSRLSYLSEEKRDEKRKKIIEILLSK